MDCRSDKRELKFTLEKREYNMSRIEQGQTFDCNIVDILNTHFAARTTQAQPLAGYQRSSWPQDTPFLINMHDTRREEAVVWFPIVTDNPNSRGIGDWLNVVTGGGNLITTMYVGESPFQVVYDRVGRFIGKNHIVFARRLGTVRPFEFMGVYKSFRKDDKFVYGRFAKFIETNAWNRCNS